jgi:ribonucleoside-diphosphate reductase alpha chain
MICHNAWQTGEPGLSFIDEVQRTNTVSHKVQIETSNPCGEQQLPPWGNCALASINIASFIKEDRTIDFPGLARITQTAVRFLDNSIDVNSYPIPEIREQALNDRRIGIGIMGFADALYKMRLRYNSPEGYAVAETVMGFINDEAHKYSMELAKERGSFRWWEGSYWDKQHHKPMRNCMLTNVAPTGTISILADCSGGLEPLFSLGFWRTVLNGQVMWQGNKYFDEALKEAGISDADKQLIYDYIAGKPGSKQEGAGTLFGCPVKLPEWIKSVFVTARDIPVRDHITMQAAFQKHVDNAVSKTVNLPENAKVEEVADAFLFAYKNMCKGITVYRDKCRANQPMSVSVGTGPDKKQVMHKPTKKKLPRVGKLIGYKFSEPLGDVYVNIRYNDREINEMFANTERSNTLVSLYVNALSRVLSTSIRYGVPAEAFEFLEKMHDPEEQPPIIGPFGVTTGPEAFGRALKFFRMGLMDDQAVVKHHKDTFGELEKLRQELNKLPDNFKQATGTLCPECNALMYPNPGCSNGMLCYSCGYTTGHCKG